MRLSAYAWTQVLRRVNRLAYNMQYGPKLRARLPLFILVSDGVRGEVRHAKRNKGTHQTG